MKKIILILMMILMINIVTADEQISIRLLNQDPDPAISGDTLEVRFGIENVGDDASNELVIELEETYPFEAVTGESLVKDIGVLGTNVAGDFTNVVKFVVKVNKDATAGTYSLPILLYEKGKRNANEKRLISVDISSKDSAEVIYIDQVELIPGKITPLKFTINNVGSTPLRELSFQWENEDDIILPVGSDNTKYIKYIDVGESAELEFNVIASANADPDLYKLDLLLTYEDPLTGVDKEISTKAGVYVGGVTDFDAAFSGSSDGESTFSISNIGSVSATSVTVRIPDQQGWKVTGSNSVIIGNLNEGDYTIASFTLTQTGGTRLSQEATEEQNTEEMTPEERMQLFQQMREDPEVKLEIIYTDSRGNRHTVEKTVPVDTSNQLLTTTTANFDRTAMYSRNRPGQTNILQSVLSAGKWVLLIGGVVLVFFVRRRYTKGKLKNPQYSYMKAFRDLIKRK